MKLSKKLMSVLLAALIALSSISAGLTAFAQENSEEKAYDGLDANYRTLAVALTKEYVTKAEYETAERNVTVTDNEDGDIYAAAKAFFDIFAAMDYKKSPSTDQSNLVNFSKTISDTLKKEMGSDYTAEMETVVTKYLNGLGTSANANKAGEYGITINYPMDSYLMKYDTFASLPESISSSARFSYKVVSKGFLWNNYPCSEVTENNEFTVDKDSPAAIKAYGELFSKKTIETDFDKIDPELFEGIAKNGQKAIDNVSKLSKAVYAHFFNFEISAAQNYLNGLLASLVKDYKSVISQLKELCDGKSKEDFSYASLEEVKKLLDNAEKLYNSYTESQKEEAKKEYAEYEKCKQLYTESFNYNVKKEYVDAVVPLEKYTSSDYEIQKSELADVKAKLDEAAKIYDKFIGEVTDDQVVTCKEVCDAVTKKYEAAAEKFELEEYNEHINILADLFNSSALEAVSSASVTDNANGDVATAMEAYSFAAEYLNRKDSAKYSDSTKIAAKICDDLKAAMGDGFKSHNVKTIISDYMGGGALSSDNYNKTFSVTPYYMAKYKSVSEIPKAIDYEVVIYTYNHTYSDKKYVFTSIKKSTEKKQDTTAYAVFNRFNKVFTDSLFSADFSKYSIAKLAEVRSDAEDALKGVSVYDENTLSALLGQSLEKAKAVVQKCDEFMAVNFSASVDKLNKDFGDKELQKAQVKAFLDRCAEIEGDYGKLSEPAKESETVVKAYKSYEELKKKLQGDIDRFKAMEFIQHALEFVNKYPDSKLTFENSKQFEADLQKIFDEYAVLSEEAIGEEFKEMIEVSDCMTMIEVVSNKMAAVVNKHYYDEYIANAEKRLAPYYTDNNGTVEIKNFNVFDVSKINSVIKNVNEAYSKLSDADKQDEKVLYYNDIVTKLQNKVNDIVGNPKFEKYDVQYPDGVSKEQVEDILKRLDAVLNGPMIEQTIGRPLDEFVITLASNALFKDDTINKALSALYPQVENAVKDYKNYLGLVGLYVTPKTVSERTAMNEYPQAQKVLKAAGDNWENVNWAECKWVKADGTKVTDIETFCDALGAGLQGINNALKALLTGDSIKALGFITIMSGNEGYDKDILPLLEVLGCKTVPTSEFKARNNLAANMLRDILIPLFNRVQELLHQNTVSQIVAMLPDISYVMTYNLIKKGVEDLASPLAGFGFDVNKILGDAGIDLSDPMGLINKALSGLGVVLPNVNWAEFAGIGEWQTDYPSNRLSGVRNHINGNNADVTVQLVYYIFDVLKENSDLIMKLIGNGSQNITVSAMMETILKCDNKKLAQALFTIFTAYDTPDYVWNMNWTKTKVVYPSSYSSKDVDKLVSVISDIVTNVVNTFLDGSLEGMVAGKVYSGENVNKLFTAVYSALQDETVSKVLSLTTITGPDGKATKIDVSKDAVVKMLQKDYPKAAKAVKKADTFKDAEISADAWKVKDSASFAKAICTVLSPFDSVITALLAGKDITVDIAGLLVIKGANGYNNAVMPLLDALSCSTLSVKEFNAQAKKDPSSSLYNIVTPLLGLVERIAKDPVNSVIEIAPKAALFIDNGGIQTAVKQLLSPLNNVLNAIAIVVGTDDIYDWLVKKFISPATGLSLDWNNLQNQIVPVLNEKVLSNLNINGAKLSLKLPDIKWSVIAGCTVSAGGQTVKSDSAVTILKYLWKTVQTNKSEIKGLVKKLAGSKTYKTISPYIDKLLKISGDKAIEILVNLTKGLDASSFKADWSFLYKDYSPTAVKYPAGVSAQDIDSVVKMLTAAINNALSSLLDVSLSGVVTDKLYTNSIINSLAKSLYSIADNKTAATVFDVLGIDISKDAIAKSLKKEYPAVSKSIASASSLSKLNTSSLDWKVKDKDSFVKAFVAVLRPFGNVLNVLLNSGSISVAGVVGFTGANGYENAVKPILDVLGCNSVSVSKYQKDAKKNTDNLLINIIDPLLTRVDEILNNPIKEVTAILPQVSNFISKGGVQKAVENLIYPITNLVKPVLSVLTNDSVFDLLLGILKVDAKWESIHNEIIPVLNKSVLSNIKINSKSISLTLPNISWSALAGCGKLSGNSIKADVNAQFMLLVNYVFKVLEQNKADIISLIGSNPVVSQIIGNVIKCGPDGFTKILVNILLKMQTFDNVSWNYKNIGTTRVGYTKNYNKEDYAEALTMIDPMIDKLLTDFAGSSLKPFVTNTLYTNAIVNKLAKLIYTSIENLDIGIDLNTVLSLADIDISTKGVASSISDYSSASREIKNHSKWKDVNFDKINWGFKDGDRKGFVNALAAVLRPLYPALRAVLSGEDLVVLGSISIKGGNGYNTAVIPILEALGVDEKALVSPAKYAKDADTDKVITNILNPLLDRAEQILQSPVVSLADTLPNLAYFVYNGGVKASVENLIAPVTNILKEIDPIYSVNINLSSLENPNLADLANSILGTVKIDGQPLGIKLSNIDLAKLSGIGRVVDYKSMRTYNGERMTAKRVEADSAAVFISVLRYLVSNIKTNLDAINALLARFDIPENILGIINQVLDALVSSDIDDVIEMLMDLLFGGGGESAVQNADKAAAAADPFNLGDFYWAYWVTLAGLTLLVCAILYLISRKIKKKSLKLEDMNSQEEIL